MEVADGQMAGLSPVVTIILLFFFAIGYVFQVQGHLNDHWDAVRFAALPVTPQTPAIEASTAAALEPHSPATGAAPLPSHGPAEATRSTNPSNTEV
jgi:hypothetical protein